MAGFRVVLDTNVLFPIVQADLLLNLAGEEAFVPLWSAQILDELCEALVRTGKTTSAKATRRVAMMNEAFPDAQVLNWEELVNGVHGIPDTDDRHVVAVAIEGNASAIVTNNLKDFPTQALQVHGLHAKSSDDFLLDLFDLFPSQFLRIIERMCRMRKNPPVTRDDLLQSLSQASPKLVEAYRLRFC